MARYWLFALALVGAACTNDDPPACITVDTSCAPLYPPTFDNVYNNTLSVSCGSTNSSCHSSVDTASAMSFADEATSYAELLAKSHLDPSRYRVVPGNPGCSLMIVRTDSPGASYQMPIGTPLSEPERCALVQWVEVGAPGPSQGELAMKTIASFVLAFAAACSSAPKDPVSELQDPSTCGDCHIQHYQEWSSSMHAYASVDPVFVAMNKRGQRDTQNQLGTFCVQCHAPMAVALNLTDGTDFNPTTLPPAANGVTCYFCHDVKSVEADHNNGLVLAMDQTMRGGVSNPVDTPAHDSKYDAPLMASETNNSTMCGSCHDVVTPSPPSPTAVALERTYSEWQTTIFATTPPPTGITCSGCHMSTGFVEPPTTVIADKPGLNVKSRPYSFHEHLWLGIDQALTPFPGTAAMPPTAPALTQAQAIQRDLDPALTIVGATPIGDTDGQTGPGYIEGGICVTHEATITVRMDTRGTGHMWPSGASQDRRAWLQMIAYDANNNVLFQTGVVPDGMDPEDIGDPNLVGFWDRVYQADGTTPAHFFWQVASEQSKLLRPPVTLMQSSPLFDHSTTATFGVGVGVTSTVDHIAAQLLIRPYNYAMLNDLVSSGDLDASFAAMVPTLTMAGTMRTWTKANVDPVTDGCDSNPFQ